MKFCADLNCEQPVFGGKFCRRHQWKRKKSDEQIKYSRESKAFIKKGDPCELKTPVCTGIAVCVHHKKSRGKNLNKKETWMKSCIPCNNWVEVHDKQSREKGLKESRY